MARERPAVLLPLLLLHMESDLGVEEPLRRDFNGSAFLARSQVSGLPLQVKPVTGGGEAVTGGALEGRGGQ